MLGNALDKIQESGCSLFFITSSVMSFLSGKKNRKASLENAEKDESFQRELQRQKERYDDAKEAKERAFRLWIKQKQRQWTAEETARRLENELSKADMQMFFEDWPLQKTIATINGRRLTTQNSVPLNVIIARHSVGGKDPFTMLYSEIVNQVETYLGEVNLYCVDEHVSKVCIHRFKVADNNGNDRLKVVGGPALANIYAMMSTFPSIVIQPKIDIRNKKMTIFLACWNQDSSFPFQRKIMELGYDTSRIDFSKDYFEDKIQEIIHTYVTISIVFNDTYSLLENESDPLFPEFAKKHKIAERYPLLIEFARKEYSSLLGYNGLIEKDETIINVVDYLNGSLSKGVRSKLEKVLKELKND